MSISNHINRELNEQTKMDIETAREEYKQGKFRTHAQVKKELGL